jgi:hypothetical protein
MSLAQKFSRKRTQKSEGEPLINANLNDNKLAVCDRKFISGQVKLHCAHARIGVLKTYAGSHISTSFSA